MLRTAAIITFSTPLSTGPVKTALRTHQSIRMLRPPDRALYLPYT